MQAAIQHPNDRPALSQITQFVQCAQIAEEALRFVGRLETQDRIEECLEIRSPPVVNHVARPPLITY